MQVRLVNVTENPERFISYVARVSNPNNQENPEYAKLIKYLIRNKHFSPFEHAYMTVEIKTSRAIAAQILRHRSFTFQEYSQRYSEATAFEPIEIRKQAVKNRQSSEEVFDPLINTDVAIHMRASELIESFLSHAKWLYGELLNANVAKESARFILPLTTQTTLYMTGSARSWIHYLDLRDDSHTQKEHQLIAKEIRQLFDAYFPTVAEALALIKKEDEDKALLYRLLMDGKIQWPI